MPVHELTAFPGKGAPVDSASLPEWRKSGGQGPGKEAAAQRETERE